MKNLYRLQTRDRQTYFPSTRERINLLIEEGQAAWIGTDYNEKLDAVIHYADRMEL